MVVIRFRDPRGIDFPYLLSMIPTSFMSRANSIVIPGGKLDLAMQLILTPHDSAAHRAQAPHVLGCFCTGCRQARRARPHVR